LGLLFFLNFCFYMKFWGPQSFGALCNWHRCHICRLGPALVWFCSR
jgi:hypothetical protein